MHYAGAMLPRRLHRALACLTLLCFACEDEPSEERFPMGEHEVVLSDRGIELWTDGEATFALAQDGPVRRSYTETVEGTLAIYEYTRTDESVEETSRTSATRDGDAILIEFEGQAGRGTLRIREENNERVAFRFEFDEERGDSVTIPVRCDEAGSFHGFGVQYDGTDLRGSSFDLISSEQGIGRTSAPGVNGRTFEGDPHTTYFPMPYWMDGRGHGVLFRTDERVRVDLCDTDENVAGIEVTSPGAVEWVVFTGPEPLDVIRQLGEEVGTPAPLPDWAFGLWLAAQGGREEVLAEVDAVEAADLPVSAFWVQDWTGRRMNFGGGFGVQYRWEADDEFYPDLPGLVTELRERGYRFLAYANPFIDTMLPNHFEEMEEQGLLLTNAEGEAYTFFAPNGMSAHPDLTNPAAREYVVGALRAMIRDYGFDGWMQDFSEWTPLDAQSSTGETGAALHNRFTVLWQQMAMEAFEAERPGGDYAFFGRAGWRGAQGVSQIHWIGDQEADFLPEDGLPTVVPGMLGLGLAGQPNVTHDIAGFSGGPSTKELHFRWTELGAFTPIMRTHEGNARDRNWDWNSDEETIVHFRRFVRIHALLEPLFRELADRSQASGHPMVEHLMLAYPEDRETWAIDDQFLLGPLLVAPVTGEGETSRSVYLPEGQWFHVWSGEEFTGPARIDVEAPLGSPPVFSLDEDRADLRAVE